MPAQMDASLQPSGLTAALVEEGYKTTVWVQCAAEVDVPGPRRVDHVENRSIYRQSR